MMDESLEILNNKKSINKSDRNIIKNTLTRVLSKISSSLPFLNEQFTESMEKTISEAKTSIDAHHLHRIISLGTEAYMQELKEENEKALDYEDNNMIGG